MRRTRREALQAFLGVGVASSLATGVRPGTSLVAAERARRAYAALRRDFMDERAALAPALVRGEGGRPYPYVWPLSRVLAAALALAGVPGESVPYVADARRLMAGLAHYWDESAPPAGYASYPPPPAGTGGDLYYDDNAWAGIELLDYHALVGDEAPLAAARRLFDLLVSGWEEGPAGAAPGGVYWVRAGWSRRRATVSTGPAALLGLRLYALTGDGACLEWAERMLGWLHRYLRGPDGLFYDHITPEGRLDTMPHGHNQGALIGACLLRHRLGGERADLRRAEGAAEAALRHWGGGALSREEPAFAAILCRQLLALWAQTGTAAYRRLAEAYADRAWARARDPARDAFAFPRRGDAGPGEQALLGQAAMAEVHALLAQAPARLLPPIATPARCAPAVAGSGATGGGRADGRAGAPWPQSSPVTPCPDVPGAGPTAPARRPNPPTPFPRREGGALDAR